ncbi:WD repeat-containing protein 70 [Procambarus clarkii]|uniref:WD repeat-containing protein 70 n=1 Tax=Procambarus clarkii TaxID=6728 RepID=UPI001E6711FD|nr:WD repeat-containing protein 70-like [Procambarus clarkii]XP_045594701.1 WD repeat-containing protein 70-like [Procambarus clarkii]XP_045594702.1 WD repeat-containing protein 70-like [Procambarus clarkii]XP_045594703.1 WD repeat-containing protein 70-like [Procambarus clarkii]
MNRGKISFGKIGFSLGSTKPISELSTTPCTAEDAEEQTASITGFGSFGKIQPEKNVKNDKEENDKEENEEEMANTMGFSGFGKKARDFDISQLAEETRKAAIERNRNNIEKLKLQLEAKQVDNKGKADDLPLSKDSTPSSLSIRNDDSSEDEDFIGPPLPPSLSMPKASEDDESDDEEEYKIPVTHELVLEHGTKTVSGLSVDPSGTRLVTGGLDYDVRYWDFQGMDQAREAFRSFCPSDGYPVNSVEYSCTGDKVLVVPGSAQAKVYDRDGIELFECARGDMYLHDMAKTKGHVAGLTCGAWHPKDKEEFMTSARDGTCRLWHTSQPHSQKNVIKARALNGLKTVPTTCAFSKDGLLVACACDDGSIQMWDHRKNFVNVTLNIKNAHTRGSDTSRLVFAYDNKGFATRGGDDTLKLWDMRNTKQAVHIANDLYNRFGMTDCVFSPNDQILVTGTSLNRGETSGKLLMYNRNTWEIVKELEVGTSHIVKIIWHPRLNQIMLGCGDGKVRLLYEPKVSHNGAILVVGKHRKRSKQAEVVVSQQVITPHALPMFREERHKSTRKLEERDRKDPVKSRQPDLPVGKAGSGGRVSAGGSTLSSYIIRNMGLRNKVHEEGDPREALLKYAKDAEENPYWVTPAYTKNQPKPVFQDEKETKVEEIEEPATKKIKSD